MNEATDPGPITPIGPVEIDTLSHAGALAMVGALLDAPRDTSRIVAFCNAHTVNLARRDPAFAAALAGARVLNDGIGVDIARRLLHGKGFPTNLNGTDFTSAVLEAAPRPLAIYLLGSPPGVAERAAQVLTARFPRHRIVGARDGFFDPADGAAVAAAIAATGADFVLAGMGQPRQERWAAAHGAATGAVVMCIGAYLDFVAGVVSRAPAWLRTVRAEWVYRLAQEPRRLAHRYLIGNGRFLLNVARDRSRGGRRHD